MFVLVLVAKFAVVVNQSFTVKSIITVTGLSDFDFVANRPHELLLPLTRAVLLDALHAHGLILQTTSQLLLQSYLYHLSGYLLSQQEASDLHLNLSQSAQPR